MDEERFDRLSRLFARAGSRRAALGAVLGAGLLGPVGSAAAKRPQRHDGKRRVTTQAHSRCGNPGPGQNLSKCDFTGRDLRGRSLRGTNLSKSKLAGANLCGVDLRGANLHKTDLTHAVLTRVDLRGTNLSTATLTNARFCQTRKPNGKLDHTHCPPTGTNVCCGDAECEGICQRGACLERSCRNVGQLCGVDAPPGCCEGVCFSELDIFTQTCRLRCNTNQDCAHLGDFECITDGVHCPDGHMCCRPKPCDITKPSDCSSNKCCAGTFGSPICCRTDQRCGVVPFELPCVDV